GTRKGWPVFDGETPRAIDHIQRYLFGKDIGYPQELLANFHALLCTGDLIILSGLSGSGKTNLVKSYAEATGNEARIVPVKPNWTSAEDLIGFHNPLQRAYATTPFLDALFEAKSDPERLYIVCLDEMNLARVEYYFADFLSRLEDRADPSVELYPDD
ncbi:MAG: AAA family ATPase, partial [Chromatiaceae bacterium]|nr:AAA family ATPase [Chromatiaceae bacterium]